MAADAGTIVAYGATSAPTGWLLCDGSFVSQATYSALFSALGHAYNGGTDPGDGTFKLPDLRGRFALGKAASGTGSTLGGTGGAIDHTHTGPSHSHGVDQPAAHSAHSVTQPSAHTTLTHSGAAVSDHSSMTHSGAAISDHSISSEAGTHATHTANATHTHDSHTLPTDAAASTRTYINAPATHAANTTHTHDAHPAHTGSTVDSHAVTQANAHSADTHTVSAQPGDHTSPSHAGATVTGAHTHTGMATAAGGTGASGTANPPFLVIVYIVADGSTGIPSGAVLDFAGSSAPANHLLCDGASYDTTTYAELFGIIGYSFGGSGANFNVPDLRSAHPLGKAASGTGSTLGETGGSAAHTHSGPSHTHSVTQADAHGSHSIGQSSDHSLSHSGLTVSDHGALTHSGLSVATHVVGQPSAHGAHASAGAHTHDSHTVLTTNAAGAGTRYFGPLTHSSDGGHTHTDTHTHSGQALDAHSVTAQPSGHGAQSHSVTQPDSHSLTHSGADLDAHSAHANGAANAGGTAATGTADAPYLVVNFIIKAVTSSQPVGAGLALGTTTIPGGALAADGTSYLRTDYQDLFDVIGTAYGAVDGTHFNVPDLRGKTPKGKGGALNLGDSGGGLDHLHTGPSHTHPVTQPDAHSNHSPTQPSDHTGVTHSGFAISDHAALSHSGLTLANHASPTQAASHGTHTSEGGHTHDAHTSDALAGTSGTTQPRMSNPATHSSQGAHTHDAHAAHSGFALTSSVHSVSSSGSDHAARSHSALITQPSTHGTLSAHSGFAVDAHSAHTGFATQADGTGNTGTANPPFQTVVYAIQAESAGTEGTGAITIAAPSVAGTGLETMQGSGAEVIAAPAVSATGLETISGSGALVILAPSVAGTGIETFSGTGALVIAAPAIASSGLVANPVTGLGGVVLAAPTLDGSGLVMVPASGDGAVVIAGPILVGSGSGGLVLPSPGIPVRLVRIVSGRGRVAISRPRIKSKGEVSDDADVMRMAALWLSR